MPFLCSEEYLSSRIWREKERGREEEVEQGFLDHAGLSWRLQANRVNAAASPPWTFANGRRYDAVFKTGFLHKLDFEVCCSLSVAPEVQVLAT